MIFSKTLVLWFITIVRLIVAANVVSTDENGAKDILRSLNEKSAETALRIVRAQWEFETNNTEVVAKELITSEAIKDVKLRFQNIINNYPWKSFTNPDIRRQFKLFSEIGTLSLPDEEYQEFQEIFLDLKVIEQNTTVCDYHNKTKCDLHLNPDIKEKLETTQNPEELSYLWTEWRKATELEYINLLEKFVKLCNKAASLNHFENFRDYSLRNIEAENVKQEMKTFWEEIKPLYSQIHAYFRKKLRDIYGEKIVSRKGPIPAYLLGDIWSKNWLGIALELVPFPEHDNFNFTSAMIRQDYNQEKLHNLAEDYFASMNFSVPSDLWFNDAEKPFKNNDVCHPKIFNFYSNGVRIKHCKKISLKEFLEDTRLLTKAEYMLQYSGQPFVYQSPADPGLEEAMSDVMDMSASTFDNLKKLGLYDGPITEEIRLNRLFKLASEKITSIPFLLVQEFWRWEIFNGKTLEDSRKFVSDLREEFQGISTFTKELTFDPGGIGSAFSESSLVHRFYGFFLEFQLYEFLCQMPKESQQGYDLNECNLYQNVDAGVALRSMMSLGSSKPLNETLSYVFGVNKITSKSILKYFEPLTKWLTKENEKTGEFIGWERHEVLAKKENSKTRRKRSLDDYQIESKDDDGDSNSDFNSNIAPKETGYGNMFEYNRMKSVEGRNDPTQDIGANKLWSIKSFLTDNAKIIQSNPSLDKKETLSSSHLTSSLIANAADEKSIGKKETSPNNEPGLTSGKERSNEASEGHLMQNSESKIRHLNIDMPSLQALLQKVDMNAFGQRQIFAITPEAPENKAKYDMNSLYRTKSSSNKLSNSYLYKYAPVADTPQFKDKKEFREDLEAGSKSPYIIILGQIAPDMRDKLMHEKGIDFQEALKDSHLRSGFSKEEKKVFDKRNRGSEQIYIVPVNLKNDQHNLMKPNHYAEHEREVGHDPNTERDQESEEEQLHLEDNSKLQDKSNFYKMGKENPSEFIISWNNDKNKKIVKRSKREYKKDIGDEKLKVVRIAPVKQSFLEGLLSKSLDHASLNDKNVKILIHDGLINGNSDLSPALASSHLSMGPPAGMAPPEIDQSQTSSLQPSSSLSSLASSVLSALSPKSYTQTAKASNQHQEADIEEDNLKDSGNTQSLGKTKGVKLYSDDDTKKLIDVDPAAKGDEACCKKIILSPCPPKPCCPSPCPCPLPCPLPCPCPCPLPCPCPPPCPSPCPAPCPCPCPCPDDCCKRVIDCPPLCCRPECPDLCCKKPSECSLVNCQFKITKAKKPHERLTIMIYDRINPPAELPEPYDALAVISEILQRIQCCSCKPCCQLTEEDPDYPANDNSDQLKGNSQAQDNKAKIQELSGEIPILGSEAPEEDEIDDNPQVQISPNAAEDDKYQPKEKATPAIDQLTVFNKDKLKPVFIELRKIDDIIKKRSHKE